MPITDDFDAARPYYDEIGSTEAFQAGPQATVIEQPSDTEILEFPSWQDVLDMNVPLDPTDVLVAAHVNRSSRNVSAERFGGEVWQTKVWKSSTYGVGIVSLAHHPDSHLLCL